VKLTNIIGGPPVRVIIGALFLCFQVFRIAHARFTDVRYFCWAPHDRLSPYQVSATVNGRALSGDEIKARYHIDASGVETQAQEIYEIVELHETAYPIGEDVRVRVVYQPNGRRDREYAREWPQRRML
jgi:hypothetical protein